MSSLHRGTLKQCILAMAEYFKKYNYTYLSILFSPAGHYYTLIDDLELDRKGEKVDEGGHRLVCRLSNRELYSFTRNDQLNMFAKENHAEDQKNI